MRLGHFIGVLCLSGLLGMASTASTVHTVFPTECTKYFTWQSMGMMLSHRLSGQPGPLTRIMSCTHEEYAAMSDEERNICPTHVAPSYTHHPRLKDNYSAYNKPVAVIDWLARTDVTEDYVLIIDADMIMLTPFIPEVVGAAPGWAVSAYFSYMKGVNNKLALKHVPEVVPRNDTLAGPKGRRGDMVGGFTLMNTQDLRRVAPLWLKYTEDVRFDDEAWTLSGDHYSIHPGDRPWISEMYGYSYGASKANVWHRVDPTAMLYPGYEVRQLPKVLHYGLKIDTPKPWAFDKHWHFDFEALMCPPWDLSAAPPRGKKGGLFPHPPDPESLTTGTSSEQLRDLLAIQTVVVLNAALCERHLKACPPSDQLTRECDTAQRHLESLQRRVTQLAEALPDPCHENDSRCPGWAAAGECESNSGWMSEFCPISCNKCVPRQKKNKNEATEKENVERIDESNNGGGSRTGTTDTVTSNEQVSDAPPVLHDTEDVSASGKAATRDATAGGGGEGLLRASATTDSSTKDDDQATTAQGNREEFRGEAKPNSKEVPPERVELFRARCMRQPHWSMGAVKACLSAAQRGEEYKDPSEGASNASGTGVGLGERTRRLVAGAEDEVRLVASSAIHRPGLGGFLLWILVLVVLLWSLPRVRHSLSTPSSAIAAGRGFFGLRPDKAGRRE